MMLRAIVAASFMAAVATAFSPPMAHPLARTANSVLPHPSQNLSDRAVSRDITRMLRLEWRMRANPLPDVDLMPTSQPNGFRNQENALIAEQDQEERKKKEEAAESAPPPPMIVADDGLQHWKEQKAADRAKQDEEVEAKMARWMAEAAAKKD